MEKDAGMEVEKTPQIAKNAKLPLTQKKEKYGKMGVSEDFEEKSNSGNLAFLAISTPNGLCHDVHHHLRPIR